MRLSVNRNIFFSPLIAQNLITFFADYIPVYLDPCIDLYSSGPERRSRALSLHGEDFNDVLVLLCHSCQHCIVAHPLEEDLLTSVSKLIQALASSEQRLGIIVSQSSIMEIYAYVSRTTDDLGITNCRLSPVGLATMTEALVKLSSQKGCRTLFVQLCSTAHDRLEHLSSIAEGNPAQETRPEVYEEISACTATLIGISHHVTPL
jgi:hypothetical protein